MLEHGGALLAAAARYGIEPAGWLDLSTGINPAGWPVPPIPAAVWQRLPETRDGLAEAAAAYYGCGDVLPVAGSQAAIQALPRLRAACRARDVGVYPAAPFYARPPARAELLLGYASLGEVEIRTGIRRLREALDAL